MGSLTELFFSFRAVQGRSLNKLSLLSHYSSWLSLFCSPLKICPDPVGILSFLFALNPHTVSAKRPRFLKGPPELQHNRNCSRPPARLTSKQTGAVDSSPSWSNTKKSPYQPSTHTTSLLVQAVTACKAFPQAEHMDLIKCRSLTMISCPNSPNCLCLNPPLHLLLLPLQPEQSCFPTCMFFFFLTYLTTTGQVRTSLQQWGSQH